MRLPLSCELQGWETDMRIREVAEIKLSLNLRMGCGVRLSRQ
jgi:hypothetical protein